MKYEYFEQEWKDKPDWIERAKSETKRLWERDYKGSEVGPAPGASPGARENDILHGLGLSSSQSPLVRVTFAHEVTTEESAWQMKKRARLTRSHVDPLERFQQLPVETFEGMQDYWVKAMDTGIAGLLGRDLPRMGVELNAIPAMSTEAERIFSGYEGFFPALGGSSRLTLCWQRSIHNYGSASVARRRCHRSD
jgi:hypothetical protein